jgi:nephrocystin-4
MSRAAYAKLQSAKFPPILDRFGKMAEVVDGNSYIKFDLKKEESDMLTCNQIIIQFLAFSRTLESLTNGQPETRPRAIFLTFQFYRFPEFRTPKLALDKIMENYSLDSDSTPFILKAIETDKNQPNENSGYMVIKLK